MEFIRVMSVECEGWEFIKHQDDDIIFICYEGEECDYIENGSIGNSYEKLESVCTAYLGRV